MSLQDASLNAENISAFFDSVSLENLREYLYSPETKKLFLIQAYNFEVMRSRILPKLFDESFQSQVQDEIALKLMNYHLKRNSLYIVNMIDQKQLTNDNIDQIIQKVIDIAMREQSKIDLLSEVVKFMTLIQGIKINAVENFLEDYYGLPLCLRLSRESIKRLLIENSEDITLLKKWTAMAKKGKAFYESTEAKFFHHLLQKCFIEIVNKKDYTEDEVKLCLRYLDFINLYLSSTKQKHRIYTICAIQDQHILVRAKLSHIMADPLYQETFKKRCDELRHYINHFIEYDNASDESEEQKTQEQMKDQRFYKKLSLFNKICYKFLKDDYQKITSQFIGSIDQEENLREILNQLDTQPLLTMLQTFNLPYPENLESSGKLNQDQIITEILVEELTRYQDNTLEEISLFPTEEDLWLQGTQVLGVRNNQNSYLDLQDFGLREFDKMMGNEIKFVKDHIEKQIKYVHPLFGEETGEFIDFTGWSSECVRISKVEISNVKPPKIGRQNPQSVQAQITFQFKDYKNAIAKNEWFNIKANSAVYMINLEQDVTKKNSEVFAHKYGIKMIRGGLLTKKADQKYLIEPTGKYEEFILNVYLDPVQYRQDLQKLVVSESKFLEDIYSECQLLVKVKEDDTNIINMDVIRTLQQYDARIPEWVNDLFLNNDESNEEEKITTVKVDISNSQQLSVAVQESLNNKVSVIRGSHKQSKIKYITDISKQILNNNPRSRILILGKDDLSLSQVLYTMNMNGQIDYKDIVMLSKHRVHIPYQFNSKYRVEEHLSKRDYLLNDVSELAKTLDYHVFLEYTCERAKIFYDHVVKQMWDEYLKEADSSEERDKLLVQKFPFKKYISQYLRIEANPTQSIDELLFSDITCAQSRIDEYWNLIEMMFNELNLILPFENLRNNKERNNFIVCQQSRIIGTSANNCLNRFQQLRRIGFTFDTVIINDASLITQLDFLISLYSQKDINKLQRIILIGDNTHQTYMQDSLFAQVVNTFKYDSVTLFDSTAKLTQAQNQINGLQSVNQFVNVPDFRGKGMEVNMTETGEATVHNLAEAEFVVATFMYLRTVCGISREMITIFATEEGQKNLIEDILRQKCSWHPLIGVPTQRVQLLNQQQSGDFSIALISTCWTNMNAIVRKKIDDDLIHNIVTKGNIANIIFMRQPLFAYHIINQPTFTTGGLKIQQGEISDFRQLYKIVQKELIEIENNKIQTQ